MSDFKSDLFTHPDQYEESLLRERKACVKYWEDASKAEFVRDVIALANTARMLGKPAYLILGMKNTVNNDENDICGIEEMIQRRSLLDQSVTNAFESLRREMADIIRRYIVPILNPEIKFNIINDKKVGYILIKPLATSEPFHVKEQFQKKGTTYLTPGQCWLRFGESKHEIEPVKLAPGDNKLRYCYSEVPYVLPSIWQLYLEEMRTVITNKWQKFHPVDDNAYQQLKDKKAGDIEGIVEGFLGQEHERLLVLHGGAGSGKSLFLEKMVDRFANQGQQEMMKAEEREEFRPPQGFIPVYCPLRELSHSTLLSAEGFMRVLCRKLSSLWRKNPRGESPNRPELLFDNPELRWLFLLDGLDEVGGQEVREEFLRILLELLDRFPRIKIVLTSRPVMPLESLDRIRLVEISPFEDEQIEAFFGAYKTDDNDQEINSFICQCKTYKDIWSMLSTPVYLNAAVSVMGVAAEVKDAKEEEPEPSFKPVSSGRTEPTPPIQQSSDTPDIGQGLILEVSKPITEEEPGRINEDQQTGIIITRPRLTNRIYDAFWEREADRRNFPDPIELRSRTHQMAAKSMTRLKAELRRDTAKRKLTADGLKRSMEMGILADNEYGNIFFNIPTTQIYSAAKQLQADEAGRFWSDIFRYQRRWEPEYRAEIEGYFSDLTGRSLSSILERKGVDSA